MATLRCVPRRVALQLLAAALLASLLSALLAQALPADPARSRDDGAVLRIVSLAPAITETLIAIGAEAELVAVSDYCELPAGTTRPRVGSALTPSYESIARLAPTLIVTEAGATARSDELARLAPTERLPWLTTDDIAAGVRRLGRLARRTDAADALAHELDTRLSVPPPPGAPRVLLVLGYAVEGITDVWFVRKNSIHGAALAAAGGQNAVDEMVTGLPRLSVARVLELDPDRVLVLLGGSERGPGASERVLAQWRRLTTLRAVREAHVATLDAPEAFSNGPGILALIPRLRAALAGMAQ